MADTVDSTGGLRVDEKGRDGEPSSRTPVDRVEHPEAHQPVRRQDLTGLERRLLSDLFAIVEEHADEAAIPIERDRVEAAFVFACEHHADQRRKSGEDFIVHPVGVAKICAGLRLDTETLCAALLHDTVEDTTASLDEVRAQFGEEIATLVDGVTKLTGITFQSRDEAQAENYRKMMVAMASDVRVILIKLADRLHNMRTIGAMPKQKQIDKAKETLEIYAPIAHRLGIHAIKWELEDLAFAALHPRKYQDIKGLVNQQREEREDYVRHAGEGLLSELDALGIRAEIAGRAKHFYSIYAKMTKKGREFNEIYDLTAMRVIVDSVKDCYGAVGVIHSLWKPLPGRFKDFIAMPKFNMYQSLHTTVIGPEGLPLEIQIRTREMHDRAEFGVAAHWSYKTGGGIPEGEAKLKWLRSMLDWQQDAQDPQEFMEALKVDLFEDEVFVFTPKGEVKSLAGGATPLDFAYEVHTEIGHRCVGAKVNGKMVPLHYELKSGDIVEVLTSKRERGPSRDWLAVVRTTRARNKIKQWFKAESREDTEHAGRELLQEQLRKARPAGPEDRVVVAARGRHPRDGLPQGRGVLHRPGRREGVAEGRHQQGDAAPEAGRGRRGRDGARAAAHRATPAPPPDERVVGVRHPRRGRGRRHAAPRQVLPSRAGRRDRRLHLARPRHHHPPRGLRERRQPGQGPGAIRPGELGGRPRGRVQGRAAGQRLRPPPPARGPVADVRRGGHQHRRGALPGRAPDGAEPLRGRGRRHRDAEGDGLPSAQHRLGVRRLQGHARRLIAQPLLRALRGELELAHPRRVRRLAGERARPVEREAIAVIARFDAQLVRGRAAREAHRPRRRASSLSARTRLGGSSCWRSSAISPSCRRTSR